MDFLNSLRSNKEKIERWIEVYLPPEDEFPSLIHRAMRYSTLSGGKRLRAYLVLEANRIVNGKEENALPVAASIEMLHAYSLIHDDLPAMDDDDLRRGRASSHKKFGEDIAILAGDALCTFAWQLIVDRLPPDKAVEVIKILGRSVGTGGMIGGQIADMHWQDLELKDSKMIRYIHSRKTAALISASIVCGGITGDADNRELEIFKKGGFYLGMEFQIIDDLLDETGDEGKVGKKLRKDIEEDKLTYPRIYGIDKSKIYAKKYAEKAINEFMKLDNKARYFVELAQYILTREY